MPIIKILYLQIYHTCQVSCSLLSCAPSHASRLFESRCSNRDAVRALVKIIGLSTASGGTVILRNRSANTQLKRYGQGVRDVGTGDSCVKTSAHGIDVADDCGMSAQLLKFFLKYSRFNSHTFCNENATTSASGR